MKVLWFSNIPFGFDAIENTSGGWILGLYKQIVEREEVEIAISFKHKDSNFKVWKNNQLFYPISKGKGLIASIKRHLFFKDQDRIVLARIKQIIDDFQPDIIHIFGTEQEFGLISSQTKVPVVIQIQGLLNPYLNAWFPPGYSKKDIRSYRENWTYRVNRYYKEREQKILEQNSHFIGRTEWDRQITNLYSPNSRYFFCSEILRNEFYQTDYIPKSRCRRPLQLTSVISTPLYKGQDLVLKTAKLIKEILNIDFEWEIYGITEMQKAERKFSISAKNNNIFCKGRASVIEIINRLENTDIFIHPSYIDNSPNSVCEAQFLGIPVIACNVGGVSSLISHNINGILVPANDPHLIASYIRNFMEDEKLYQRIGQKAREDAKNRHNPTDIVNDLLSIYDEVTRINK